MRTLRLASFTLLFALLVAWGLAVCAQAQGPVVHYVYDDLGRLVGVVDPEGNVASYSYDAVGNLLAISRHNVADTAGPVAITLVSPNIGKVGTEVSIFGKGFSADPAQNTVSFSGAIATVSSASPNALTTTVPPGAATGVITVTTPAGSATSPEPFMVLSAITISPSSAVLSTTATKQFTAVMSGAPAPGIAWSVNGIGGGNATVGTISVAGLYTAPAAVPSPSTVTVTAMRTDDPTLFDAATVTIVDAPEIFAMPVSVGPAASPSSAANNLTARPVSVGFVAQGASVIDTLTAPPVSVEFVTAPFSTTSTLTAPNVSVGFASMTGQTVFSQSLPVAITLEPFIATVSPSVGARGVAGLSVLIRGAGFSGATGVTFELNGATDPNLSVTNLAVSPDGIETAFSLSIASGAVPGARVVRIATAAGISTATGTGGNLFTVE